jgi:hypothetical protein
MCCHLFLPLPPSGTLLLPPSVALLRPPSATSHHCVGDVSIGWDRSPELGTKGRVSPMLPTLVGARALRLQSLHAQHIVQWYD